MTEAAGTTTGTVPTISPTLAKELKSLFGPPPLGPGDDNTVYESLQARLAATIEPRDGIELMWLRDCLDLESEIVRARRAKAWVINLANKEALRSILESVITEDDIEEGLDRARQAARMADEWFMNRDSRTAMRAFMDRYDIDVSATMSAQAIALRSHELEVIDRMIALAERRRDAVIEQIELRREARARRIRAESDAVGMAPPTSNRARRQLEDRSSETTPSVVPE